MSPARAIEVRLDAEGVGVNGTVGQAAGQVLGADRFKDLAQRAQREKMRARRIR